MKEKNKKIQNQNDTIPTKGKIITAWILLIILLGCTTGLVYLKNFKQTETKPQEETDTVSEVVKTTLNTITSNFNNNANNYEEGLTLHASLNDKTITITYTNKDTSNNINYVYDRNTFQLITTFQNTDKEINDKVFKLLALSCRQRLNSKEDITNILEEFITENKEVPGLLKEETDTSTTYKIDIRYPLPEEDNTSTSETQKEPTQENTTDNVTTEQKNNTEENNNVDNKTENNNTTSEVNTQSNNNIENNTTSQTTTPANNNE